MNKIRITTEGFSAEHDESVLVIRSGEYKYTVGFTFESEVDDGELTTKIEMHDDLKMEFCGVTVEATSDLLYQLKIDIKDILSDIESDLADQARKDISNQEFEDSMNDAEWRRMKGF